MKCKHCGGEQFIGHQLCRMDVLVDGDGDFVDNMPGGPAIYDSERPYGSFQCCGCGAEYEELKDGNEPISGPIEGWKWDEPAPEQPVKQEAVLLYYGWQDCGADGIFHAFELAPYPGPDDDIMAEKLASALEVSVDDDCFRWDVMAVNLPAETVQAIKAAGAAEKAEEFTLALAAVNKAHAEANLALLKVIQKMEMEAELKRYKDAEAQGRLVILPDGPSNEAGPEALRRAMNICNSTNNAVTRYTADAIAEKLVRDGTTEKATQGYEFCLNDEEGDAGCE